MTDTKKTTVKSSGSEQSPEGATTAVEEHPPSGLMRTAEHEEELKKSPAEIQAEEDTFEKALKEASENRDRWMRAVAELENFKKRAVQERSRWQKYRHEDLLRDVLPVVDNMERAIQHCSETERCDPLADGLQMILGMLREVLAKYGVTEIQAVGQPFDPQYHEGMAMAPTTGVPPNTVIEQMEKGYMYQDRLLRPAKVVVSAG